MPSIQRMKEDMKPATRFTKSNTGGASFPFPKSGGGEDQKSSTVKGRGSSEKSGSGNRFYVILGGDVAA